MFRRLCRSTRLVDLETEYQQLMRSVDLDDIGDANYHLLDDESTDRRTFMLAPMARLVEYEDTQYDTPPRPGIPGLWMDSLRWIGR